MKRNIIALAIGACIGLVIAYTAPIFQTENASPRLRAQLREFCDGNRIRCFDAVCNEVPAGHDCTMTAEGADVHVICNGIACAPAQ
jgi:hypothetical protein